MTGLVGACARAVGALATALLFLALVPGTASGACPTPDQRSSQAFVGTVVYVKDSGRVASVRLPDGATVTVDGRAGGGGATSPERTFEVGQAYEFHPVNDTDPFHDNACTATHVVTGAAAERQPEDPDVIPWWPPFNYRGPLAWFIFTSLGFLPVVGAVVVVLVIRRRSGEIVDSDDDDTGEGESGEAAEDPVDDATDAADDIWRFDAPRPRRRARATRDGPPGQIPEPDMTADVTAATGDEGADGGDDASVVP